MDSEKNNLLMIGHLECILVLINYNIMLYAHSNGTNKTILASSISYRVHQLSTRVW